MTTNVYDGTKRLLSSDSRWSSKHPSGDFIIFVDDVGFDKIEVASGHAFLFAGYASTISDWKAFLKSKPSSSQGHPSLDGIALLITNVATGQIVDHVGQDIQIANADQSVTSFAGSGSSHAADCWTVNGCAKTAVESAKNFDLFSGGSVRYLELNTLDNNLLNITNYDELKKSFTAQGMVMYTANSHKQVPVNEAALTDVRVGELCNEIARGQISPSAPCDAMHHRATAAEKQRISATLDKIFG
ncbi:hypothetical protein Q9323_03345 [Pseudomonas fulva]|uniref:hypothetical protein n=1 Tax=Pseudomonas putida group TaxID=136845 RepID=UPI0018E6834E|nr:hypothetical protein [Pseudomonas putida]MBI6925732.1 hypothetical protein [Pseudomonas putida]